MVRAATLRSRAAKGQAADAPPCEEDECAAATGKDRVPCKGIVNLGNTCFFNSVLQNLVRTGDFVARVHDPEPESVAGADEGDGDDIDAGPLTDALSTFFRTMCVAEGRKAAGNVRPTELFNELIRQSPRYKGYQQHDAHELLTTMLDLVRMEERKRLQKFAEDRQLAAAAPADEGATETTAASSATASSEGCEGKALADEKDIATKPKRKKPPETFVEVIFGGQTRSTIKCKRCSYESVTYEPFIDLSLPIVEAARAAAAVGPKEAELSKREKKKQLERERAEKQREKKEARRKASARAEGEVEEEWTGVGSADEACGGKSALEKKAKKKALSKHEKRMEVARIKAEKIAAARRRRRQQESSEESSEGLSGGGEEEPDFAAEGAENDAIVGKGEAGETTAGVCEAEEDEENLARDDAKTLTGSGVANEGDDSHDCAAAEGGAGRLGQAMARDGGVGGREDEEAEAAADGDKDGVGGSADGDKDGVGGCADEDGVGDRSLPSGAVTAPGAKAVASSGCADEDGVSDGASAEVACVEEVCVEEVCVEEACVEAVCGADEAIGARDADACDTACVPCAGTDEMEEQGPEPGPGGDAGALAPDGSVNGDVDADHLADELDDLSLTGAGQKTLEPVERPLESEGPVGRVVARAPTGKLVDAEAECRSRGVGAAVRAGLCEAGSVMEGFREYTKVEVLEGDNLYACEACTRAFRAAGEEQARRLRRPMNGSASVNGSSEAVNGGSEGEEQARRLRRPCPAGNESDGEEAEDEGSDGEQEAVRAEVRSPAVKQALLWKLPQVG